MKTALVALVVATALVCLGVALLSAQTAVTLTPTTSPTVGQAGVTVINLTGSAFPAGTILPASTDVKLEPASGGAAVTTKATAVTTIAGTTRRVTFQIPASINVTIPTGYVVSVSGTTTTNVAFASSNKSALTINPPAQISLLSPNIGLPGDTITVAITGQFTTFTQGSTQANFGPGISVGNAADGTLGPITVTSVTSATAQIRINASATIGPRNVIVQTGVQQALLTNGFSVITPGIISILPNSASQGQALSVAITGQYTHFAQGTTTASFGAGVTVTSLTVNSPVSATAALNVSSAAATGPRTVTLTTGSEVATLLNGFTVNSGSPLISVANPNTGQQGQQALSVALTGQFTTWVQGTTTASFGNGVVVASLTVTSSTSATAVLNIDPAAPIGGRTITLNTGNQAATLNNGFTITAGAPRLTQVNPSSNVQGQQNFAVTLAGQFTNFVQVASQANFGAGITVVTLSVNSPSSATAVLNVDPTATTGAHTVTVTTGSEVVTLAGGFNVTAGTRLLSQVNPSAGQQGQQTLPVVLAGQFTKWIQGTTTASFGAGITVSSLTVSSPTSATAILNIDPAAAIGGRTITLSTGSDVETLNNGFLVNAGTPRLTQVNPSSVAQGQQNFSVALAGQFTNFVQGTSQADFGAGITVASLAVISPTSATAVLNVTPAAATGARTVTVTTAAESATLTNGLTVSAATPLLFSVSPGSGVQGQQNVSVTLTGQSSHFLQGSTQVNFGGGISVASLTVTSPTSATAILNIDAAAATGGRSVTLSTGSEVGILNNGFTVTAGTPTLSITPGSGNQGQQNLPVLITGQFTHFLQGSTQAQFGAGITVSSLTVSSPTTATALINIDAAAAAGSRSITLTTGGETATLNNGFSVNTSSPVLVGVAPYSGLQGQQNLAVVVTGEFTHFAQGASQASFGSGITVASLTVNSPTTAAAILAIDYSAAAGPRSVTMTTDAEVVVLNNGFTVTSGLPSLLTVTPNSGLQGQQSVSVAITGENTHFAQGTSQASFGPGITVASLTVNSFTSATAVLNIDTAAAAGIRSAVLITGAEIAALANAFTVTSATAGLGATPNPLAFGDVPITTSSTQTVTVSSTGTGPLTINSISIAGAFFALKNVPALPLLLAPSGTTSFEVTFEPLGTFASSGSITIFSNAANSPALVQVSGKGTPPPLPPVTAVTVTTDQPTYRRAQPVRISGTATAAGGTGISDVPVTLQVSINGSARTLNTFTDAQGNYQAMFQPAASDGGTFSVTATATSGGATKTASTTFRIFGLLISPESLSMNLLMGTSAAVPLDLRNVGDGPLNNLTYSATVTPTNSLTVSFPQSSTPLTAGAVLTAPVTLTAPAGNPLPAPVIVKVTITATDPTSALTDAQSSSFAITLRPNVSNLVLTPASLSVGANPGTNLTRKFAVTNTGYAPSNNSTVTLDDPAAFNWISLGNANLGNLAAGATQEFQVLINPPANLPLGNYTVLFSVSGGTNALKGILNVSVTQSTLGSAAFVVNDDTGSKVGAATVTLVGKSTGKVYQGVTAADGKETLTGVEAGDYTYVVTAASHDPGTGSLTVTASTVTDVSVLLVYNVVNLTFKVVPTTIPDQYTVTLNITYSTTLPKPALKVSPFSLRFSYFPSEMPNGRYPCSLSITNTHPTASVRNISVDASQIDINRVVGERIHVLFTDGSNVYQVGSLPGKGTTVLACYATLDGDNVPTHDAGNVIVQGNYDFSLDGQILEGTTTTLVPVTYTRPDELSYRPISFTYDITDPANPVLSYGGGSFVQTITSARAQTLNLLKPSGSPFNGHNLVAFTQTVGGLTSLDVINGNQSSAFWRTDFSSTKQSLLGKGDTSTYDISVLDNGVTLMQALLAEIAANPHRILENPTYLGFEGQWTDRAAPTGYLIPVQLAILNADGSEEYPFPLERSNETLPGGLGCLNPEDPGCKEPEPYIPPAPNRDGQIVIAIDQKLRLERQAFNATLGIATQAALTNTVASIQILDASGNDASSKFFVLVTGDPLGATHGGTVSGQTTVAWQLIPNANAGGTSAQGTTYQVKATLAYMVNGVSKTATTQVVTITVLPSPKLTVSYTAPFVVMAGKDAMVRVTAQNIGYGTAHNFSIESAQPRIVDTTNPNLFVSFNITGSSNSADDSGLQPGSLKINFGDVPPGGTVSGFWVVRVSRNGFFIDFTSTFKHQDYLGIQLDPLVMPPTTTLIPAIGGTVTSAAGQPLENLTVSVSQNGNTVGSDQTDSLGVYYIPDLAAGFYVEEVTDTFGNVRATKNIGVLGDQGTSLINFVLAGNAVPVTITSSPTGQSFTLAGNTYVTPQTLQLFSGTSYTVAFGSSIPQSPGTRYGFLNWSDSTTTNPRTITVGTSATTYTANFGIGYLLSLTTTPSIGGNLVASPSSADGYYSPGTQVQLTAMPTTGHKFIAFSGGITGATSPQTLTINSPQSVQAMFTAPVLIMGKHVEPNAFAVGASTMVKFSARITAVDTVIPGGVNLISTTSSGSPLSIIGQLQPVSIQPDRSYGDYELSIPINEATAKTLYFEISVAARGIVERVVSPLLPVKIYAPPTANEITLAQGAYTSALTQFTQLRTTAGDAAALNQIKTSLQQNPNVKSVQLSPDGFTLRIDFNIGTIAAITADYPPDFTPAPPPTVSPITKVDVDRQVFAAQQNSVPTPGNGSVIVLAPQYSIWNPRAADPSDAIYNGFANLPPGKIPPPVYLKDSAVTVSALKTMSQYGVISITSHGTYIPGVGSVVLSGEAMSGPGQLAYAADIQAGRVIWLNNPDAPSNNFYAITPAFVEFYSSPGVQNSIVYLNSCRSAYSSPLTGDITLADAFLLNGAGKVFGHTQDATAHFGGAVGQQLFSKLSDSGVAPAQRTTAVAFSSLSQTTDINSAILNALHGAPPNAIVSLGTGDPAALFNPSLTIHKTGSGKGTVSASSTPPLDCGSNCTAVFPPNTSVTLTATPDIGMKFNGWGVDCQAVDPTVATVTVDLTDDRTCTASFVAAIKVSLTPYGYLDFSVAPGPNRIQVVASDGVTPVSAPLDITINLTKEVSSVCSVFLTNLTIVISQGSRTADLDFVAGMAWCNGLYQPTGTKWIINSVFLGTGIARLPTVAGQTILKIFRTNNTNVSFPSPNVWLIHRPVAMCIGEPFNFDATGGPGPGKFEWTALSGSPSALTSFVVGTGSGNPSTFNTTHAGTGFASVKVKYTYEPTAASTQDIVAFELLPARQTTPGVVAPRIPNYPPLTDSEWTLTQLHPPSAYEMYQARGKAITEAFNRFGCAGNDPDPTLPQCDGMIPNAFLHAAWNYLGAKSIGAALAKEFTDAHEDFQGNLCNDPAGGGSKFMDLNNNKAGLDVATSPANGSLSESQALDRLEQMARNGELFTIRGPQTFLRTDVSFANLLFP